MSYQLTRWLSSAALVLLVGAGPAAAQSLVEAKRERPAALVPLYLTFAGLQAVDVHSTLQALDNGARESNPMVRSAMGHPAGMFVLKSGTAVGVVFLTERLWRRNRVAAVVTMIALNSAYATIAAHNYRTAATAR
jgi:hypothetical protein